MRKTRKTSIFREVAVELAETLVTEVSPLEKALEHGEVAKRNAGPESRARVRLNPQRAGEYCGGYDNILEEPPVVSVVEGQPLDLSVLKGMTWDRLVITKV